MSLKPGPLPLLLFLIAHGLATLIHFLHNAVYLDAYPNLPDSFTPTSVIVTWLAMATVGTVGFLLRDRGFPRTGTILLLAFAISGYAGLLHYVRAPFGHHTLAMNATIFLESVTATTLLIALRTQR